MTEKVCEECKINGVNITITSRISNKSGKEYWVNPDGSFHTTPVKKDSGTTKWMHVTSKAELEFVEKNGYRPQPSQIAQSISQSIPAEPANKVIEFKYQILNPDQVKLIEKEMLMILEIRHIAKMFNDQTEDKGNGAAVGNLVNAFIQSHPEFFVDKT